MLFEEKEKEENIWRGTKYLLWRIKKSERKSLTGRRRETPGIDRYPIGPTMI